MNSKAKSFRNHFAAIAIFCAILSLVGYFSPYILIAILITFALLIIIDQRMYFPFINELVVSGIIFSVTIAVIMVIFKHPIQNYWELYLSSAGYAASLALIITLFAHIIKNSEEFVCQCGKCRMMAKLPAQKTHLLHDEKVKIIHPRCPNKNMNGYRIIDKGRNYQIIESTAVTVVEQIGDKEITLNFQRASDKIKNRNLDI